MQNRHLTTEELLNVGRENPNVRPDINDGGATLQLYAVCDVETGLLAEDRDLPRVNAA